MSSSPLLAAIRREASKKPLVSKAIAIALFALPLSLTACTAHGELVADYPVVTVQTVPVEIEAYPRVYYAGSYAYLVDGSWYYRDRGRWVVFREEPRELRRYRVEYYRHPHAAPRRSSGPVYEAPPAYRRRSGE